MPSPWCVRCPPCVWDIAGLTVMVWYSDLLKCFLNSVLILIRSTSQRETMILVTTFSFAPLLWDTKCQHGRRRRRCYVLFQVETLDRNVGNSPSWLHWVCWRSTAACFQSTPLWTNDTHLLNVSCHREVEFHSYFVLMASISFNVWLKMKTRLALVLGFPVKPGLNLWLEYLMFLRRTQSEEGPLQISLHLLPDALLHVVGAVALIPLKHWRTTHTLNVRLCFKHKLCFFTALVSFKYTNRIPYYLYICWFHGSYFVGFITFPVV